MHHKRMLLDFLAQVVGSEEMFTEWCSEMEEMAGRIKVGGQGPGRQARAAGQGRPALLGGPPGARGWPWCWVLGDAGKATSPMPCVDVTPT